VGIVCEPKVPKKESGGLSRRDAEGREAGQRVPTLKSKGEWGGPGSKVYA